MSGFLEVCFVTVQVTLGSWQFWRYTIQVQHSKKNVCTIFWIFTAMCYNEISLGCEWQLYKKWQSTWNHTYLYTVYRGICVYHCGHTLEKYCGPCYLVSTHSLSSSFAIEAWAIHADKHELSKNTRQESQSTPVRAIHSIEKFQDLNLCLRRLKTTLTLATCHNNVFDHFHSHHRNQSLLFFTSQSMIALTMDSTLTACLIKGISSCASKHTKEVRKAISTHPTGNVSGSSPPKKPEDVRSFLPRLHHKMNSWSFILTILNIWYEEQHDFQKLQHLQTRPQTTIPIVDMFIVRTATTIPFTTPPTSQVTNAAFLAKHCLRKTMRGETPPTRRSSHQTGKKLWKGTKKYQNGFSGSSLRLTTPAFMCLSNPPHSATRFEKPWSRRLKSRVSSWWKKFPPVDIGRGECTK